MEKEVKRVKWHSHGCRELIDVMRSLSLSDIQYLCEQPSPVTTEFIDEFAHSKCFVLCEGLIVAGERSRFPIRGVILSEYGVDLHYLNAFDIEGQTIYIDAYGLFTRIEDISRRYQIDEANMTVFEFGFYGLQCRKPDMPVVVLRETLDALRHGIGSPVDYVRFRDNACRHLLLNIQNEIN
jgi:hypothetical protein